MDQTKPATSKSYRNFVLLLLTLVYTFNFIDRQIIGILSPFIQADLDLTNAQMGLLKGFLFALFYTIVGIPIAWLADRYNRVNIIAISLAVWSGFTAATGMATNFLTIGLARMGVGIGEAGGSPPSHSIISDLYPKEDRARALAIYSIGIPLGLTFAYFIAAFALGDADGGFNWRTLLIWLGIIGVVLAVLLRIFVREPERGQQEKAQTAQLSVPFFTALKTLLSIKSWWAMCMGIALTSFASYAVSAWQMDYLLPFDKESGSGYGFKWMAYALALAHLIPYGAGTYFGGALTQKLARNNVSNYGIVPGVAVLICLPLCLAAFWAPSVTLHLVFGFLLLFFLGMYLGPSFAIAQTLAPVNMRAMSTALFFLILNLIALGGGPTTVGFLADIFKPEHGQVHAIRLSISLICIMFVLSSLSFFIVAKTLPKDWAEAETRNEGAQSG